MEPQNEEKQELVHILSKQIIKPSNPNPNPNPNPRIIHLSAWDLRLISLDYIQKGLLFKLTTHQKQQINSLIESLSSSLSRALQIFFPLAGRLKITHHSDSNTTTIALECNDEGAEFVVATASTVAVADVEKSLYVPRVVFSFFPIDGLVNYDGHRFPLLGVQVTELADGMFIGMSLNHSVADGTSFWSFFNTWSLLTRSDPDENLDSLSSPVLDRFFTHSHPPPIHLQFTNFITHKKTTIATTECFFTFSAAAVTQLKTKANTEVKLDRTISSLQSVLAHLWRAVVRAFKLPNERETTYIVTIGCRSRMSPPLSNKYLGNSISFVKAKASAGEVVGNGVGWVAMLLHQTVMAHTTDKVMGVVGEWSKGEPRVGDGEWNEGWHLVTSSSPRFEVYGNDFGWGRPIAVRSGAANKLAGKTTVYPGPERGSITVEVNQPPSVLETMIRDEEFMEMVSMP